jgi:hypothetical protein
MEYRVTIDIPSADEAFALPIFEALMRAHPEVGPVMDLQLPDGPTSFLMGLDAKNSLAASSAILTIFREAVATCGKSDAAEASVIDLHAEVAPADELEEPRLQTA